MKKTLGILAIFALAQTQAVAVGKLQGQTAELVKAKDISENQRKLYAHNQKSKGSEIRIYDMNHAMDREYNENQQDLRLTSIKAEINLNSKVIKSSFDDPEKDRTVTVVQPNTAREHLLSDYLVQKPVNQTAVGLGATGVLDDADKTVGHIEPNSAREH